jgi:hypothetical protein
MRTFKLLKIDDLSLCPPVLFKAGDKVEIVVRVNGIETVLRLKDFDFKVEEVK